MIQRVCVLAFVCVLALLGCAAEPVSSRPAPVPPQRSQAGLALVPLEVRSGERVHRFTVEVAATTDEQARGLMFRPKVGPLEGMIFPITPSRVATFWMSNTMVPLDMIFIRANGTIARIAVNTVPYSLAKISSGEPVAAVLEVAGNRTVELGIRENDRVVWGKP